MGDWYLAYTGVAGSSYTTVNFAFNGGSTGGQELYVVLYTPDETYLVDVYLPDYIGTIAPNTWYQISIPLSDLGAAADTIGVFSLESPTATTIYLDDIRFEGTAQGGTATTYTYDHTGQRTSYFDGSATTTFPSKYYEVTGTKTTKHIYAGSGTKVVGFV